ncbi:FAD-dependent oxidoreductase [Mycolicibacterium sp.]|uniref:FAD-dependent oxidoreductase n=1 Tax=Mycolicibacterium sp. TaxID=2320850 RepID=UPI0037CA1A02
MTYVITQNCCTDASCLSVCPVDCIRPLRTTVDLGEPQMLFIDPDACVDCAACELECPVGAIYYEDDLPEHLEPYREINASYFAQHPLDAAPSEVATKKDSVPPGSLRVAVVGAGPAACYAAQHLLDIDGVEVDVYERLPTPFGLVRAGVAPDHQRTKEITDMFGLALGNPRLRCHFNVDIGTNLTHAELMSHHHAVIYAVGASRSRNLDIPGEQLAGSDAAAEFVGWYNGHPDHSPRTFDLSGKRAVIIGNGNVALDVARVLLADATAIGSTDIAVHALEALNNSSIIEVVILGRRGPREAAFSAAEFLALTNLPNVDVVLEGGDLDTQEDDDFETALKLQTAREIASRPTTEGNKRIVFRFLASPVEIIGAQRVEGLRIVRNSPSVPGSSAVDDMHDSETIEASMVLRSIGYRGEALPDLPFDEETGRIPNEHGRVHDRDGANVAGTYVTGWIKRGSRGVIGTNRSCALETVRSLWMDFKDGRLAREPESGAGLESVLQQRGIQQVDWSGWKAIDALERARGDESARPRIKLTEIAEMVEVAGASSAG